MWKAYPPTLFESYHIIKHHTTQYTFNRYRLDLILEDEPEVMILDLKMPGINGKGNMSIRVSDNGFGISEKDFKRIFEPFFTTTTNKGGTGLGLHITHGLVQEIGSSINVSLKNGKREPISLQNLSKLSF